MYLMMIILMSIFCMSIIFMKMSMMLSNKMKLNYEKMSPFECGFNPMNFKRISFSLRFFLITIIFLIFDIEITLILPMIYTMKMSNIISWLMTSTMFISILIIGLFHEWNLGALNWI